MIHLRSVNRNGYNTKNIENFPFNLPVIRSLETLKFQSQVTFLVGENGSGKSTFLEALACASNSTAVGSENLITDPSLAEVRELALTFKLIWSKRTQKGFFQRAEDFFGYSKRLSKIKEELEEELKAVDEEYIGRSQTAINFAKLPYRNELHDLKQLYGEGLDVQSHGESFLKLFQSRFKPGGLYLLDEPESPLSPFHQLSFISLLKQMVQKNSQFIIATHSPIIMAYPGADILSFDSSSINQINYEDVPHVSLTRSFLNNPESYLNHL